MKEVSVKEKTVLEPLAQSEEEPFNVAVIDFGVKGNIITYLRKKTADSRYILTGQQQSRYLQESLTVFFSPTVRGILSKQRKQ